MKKYTSVPAWEGSIGFVVGERGLCQVVISSQSPAVSNRILGERFPDARHDAKLLPGFQKQLLRYVEGRPTRFDVRVDLSSCTPFHREVLEACATIDYGDRLTYGELAALVGRPKGARAVGQAMSRNPLPLVIPCHRVVAGNGRLGGFSAEQGVSMKQRLLKMEAAAAGERLQLLAS